jgi:transposase
VWGAGGGKDTMNKANENQVRRSERRHFDETYKRHAVELTLQGGRSVKEVAEELGVTGSMLYEWRRLYAPRASAAGPAPQSLEDASQEIARLRAEVVRLRERETILKKSLGILSEPPGSGMPGSMR